MDRKWSEILFQCVQKCEGGFTDLCTEIAAGAYLEVFDMRAFQKYQLGHVLGILSALNSVKAIILSSHENIMHHWDSICQTPGLEALIIFDLDSVDVDTEDILKYPHLEVYHRRHWDLDSLHHIPSDLTTSCVGQVVFVDDTGEKPSFSDSSIVGSYLMVQQLETRLKGDTHPLPTRYSVRQVARDLAILLAVDARNFRI